MKLQLVLEQCEDHKMSYLQQNQYMQPSPKSQVPKKGEKEDVN